MGRAGAEHEAVRYRGHEGVSGVQQMLFSGLGKGVHLWWQENPDALLTLHITNRLCGGPVAAYEHWISLAAA